MDTDPRSGDQAATAAAKGPPCGRILSNCPFPPDEPWRKTCRFAALAFFCPRRQADDAEEAKKREAESTRRRAVYDALDRGFPQRLLPFLIGGENGPRKPLSTVALRAAEELRSGILLLTGPCGTGKSAGAAIAGYKRGALFRKCWNLATLDQYSPAGAEELETMATCPALIIDDLGVEYKDAKGFWASRFDFLLDARYDLGNSGWTVLTANLLPDVLEQRLGERVLDRLRECGRIVVCPGSSLRSKA